MQHYGVEGEKMSIIISGIWSPGMQHSPPTQRKSPATHESPSLKDVPRMWTPGGTPGATKKEYKPIKIETVKQPSERKTSVCI